jgi:hypothetical protein
MNVNPIICKHCNEVFITKGIYNTHYRNKHQEKVKLNIIGKEMIELTKSEEGKFICKCGKQFAIGQSFQRHVRNCQAWNNQEERTNSQESPFGNFLN